MPARPPDPDPVCCSHPRLLDLRRWPFPPSPGDRWNRRPADQTLGTSESLLRRINNTQRRGNASHSWRSADCERSRTSRRRYIFTRRSAHLGARERSHLILPYPISSQSSPNSSRPLFIQNVNGSITASWRSVHRFQLISPTRSHRYVHGIFTTRPPFRSVRATVRSRRCIRRDRGRPLIFPIDRRHTAEAPRPTRTRCRRVARPRGSRHAGVIGASNCPRHRDRGFVNRQHGVEVEPRTLASQRPSRQGVGLAAWRHFGRPPHERQRRCMR